MSIDKTNVIDFVGIDDKSGEVVLTITDHLPWGDDHKWHKEHLILLENKLNIYLQFIESGQLMEDYPDAKGKKKVINVVGRYALNDDAKSYFEKAKKAVSEAGFNLRFELFKETSDKK